METALNAIRAHYPCESGWAKLLKHLGKTSPDDEPLPLLTILESNGLRDAIWCLRAVQGHDREIRLYAVWCARQVQHLMTDPRSIAALDVVERHVNGQATREELDAADAAAYAAADAADAAAYAAADAADVAAYAAANAAANAAADAAYAADAARAAARAADAARAAADAAAYAAYAAAADAAYAAAYAANAAAYAAQEAEFRRMVTEE